MGLLAISGIRDIKRLRLIASVLTRHGFSDIAERLHIAPWLRELRRLFGKRTHEDGAVPVPVRMRRVLEDLGPTFVKFGQMLATRPDLVPMSLVMELRKLHDDVTPFPFEQVRTILEEDLGRPITSVFERLDEQPMAAASIAQVHTGRLVSGEDVVVKVQRPRLPEVISADLRILGWLARLLEERVPELRQFRPVALVDEFKRSLTRETDFRAELNSMKRYAENFRDEPKLHVPKGFPEFSSRRVLVMERLDGVKVTDREAIAAMGVDIKSLVEVGMRITLRSIFEFGFFHADPHPGNFFVQADGSIALLDFGMMGYIEPQRIDEMLTFMVALLTGDLDMLTNLMLDADLIGDDTDLRAMRAEMRSLLETYSHSSIGQVDISSFLNEVFEVAVRHQVVLPADLLLVGKAIATMEGIGREAYPEFQPLEAVRPYLTEIYVKRMLDAKRHSQVVARSFMDGLALAKDAPLDLRRVLRKLRRGELTINLRSAEAAVIAKAQGRRVNRVIMAVLFPLFFFAGIYLLDRESGLLNVAGLVSLGLAWLFFFGLIFSMLQGDGR